MWWTHFSVPNGIARITASNTCCVTGVEALWLEGRASVEVGTVLMRIFWHMGLEGEGAEWSGASEMLVTRVFNCRLADPANMPSWRGLVRRPSTGPYVLAKNPWPVVDKQYSIVSTIKLFN